MNSVPTQLRAFMLVGMLALLACIGTQTAFGSTVVVGTCGTGVHFNKIQDAINASLPANSVIRICPGTYDEQITVTYNLTLIGIASGANDAAIITSPATGLTANTTSLASGNPIAANVLVDGASKVNMTNLIVDSAGNKIGGCAPDLIGIFYRNSSGTLNRIVTRNQWIGTSEADTNLNGCQSGLGIFAQSGGTGGSAVSVLNSSVHDYQKNGITGNEVGTVLTVNGTDVVGQGPTNGAAENGIQIGYGAQGTITNNSVLDDIWAPDTSTDPGDAAAGILLYDAAAGRVKVQTNIVGNTQYGIALEADVSGQDDQETVMANKVYGTRIFDGIDVCTTGNIIETNIVTNSTESAIHLDASCGNADGGQTGINNFVKNNTITDAQVGILKDPGVTGNVLTPNTFFTAVTTDPVGRQRTSMPFKPARP